MITSNSDTFGIFGLKILKIADGQFTIVWCRSSCPTSISVFGWCIAEVRKYDNCILSLCLFAYIEIECLRNTGYKASLCFSTLEYEGTLESLLTSAVLTFQRGWLAWNPYKQEIPYGDLGDSGYLCLFTECPNARKWYWTGINWLCPKYISLFGLKSK